MFTILSLICGVIIMLSHISVVFTLLFNFWVSMTLLLTLPVMEFSSNLPFDMSLSLSWDSYGVSFSFLACLILTTMAPYSKFLSFSGAYLRLHVFMLGVLLMFFSFKNIFCFYISFELALIPIASMVLGWGYQPERLSAMGYLVMYTISSSIPFLIMVIVWSSVACVSNMGEFLELMNGGDVGLSLDYLENLFCLVSILGFLVKFPMYGLHLWLAKAHVEAPVGGSMVLAGILLKLGGYGLYLLSPLVFGSLLSIITTSFAGLGGVLISVICLRQMDMKVLIAYSSVAHMSMAIMGIMSCSMFLLSSSMMILVAHGFSSPGMFMGSYIISGRSGSRSMLLNTGGVNYAPWMSFWWFILCLGNMAAPPSLNLAGELFSVMGLGSLCVSFFLQGSFLVFLGGAYTLLLYVSTQHGGSSTKPKFKNSLSIMETSALLSLSVPLVISVLICSLWLS